MERKVGGEVRFDESYSTYSFDDGLTVSLLSCPRTCMVRQHWRNSGVCRCHPAKSYRARKAS